MGVIMQAATATDARAGQTDVDDGRDPPRLTRAPNHSTDPFSMNFSTHLYTEHITADAVHQAVTLLLAIAALAGTRGGS